MLMLLRDVLAFSQLSQTREDFVKIDLNEILDVIRNDFELLIEEKGALIESTSLPMIEGILIQIIQLFSNLVSNSLKFSAKDKRPHITVGFTEMTRDQIRHHEDLNPACSYYKISFADNGIGFS